MSPAAVPELEPVVPHRCDHCHVRDGNDFLDHFWLCAKCRHAYIWKLYWEGLMKGELKDGRRA